VGRGIWEPTEHLLQDRGKPRKTSMEMVGAGPSGCVLTSSLQAGVPVHDPPPPPEVNECVGLLGERRAHGNHSYLTENTQRLHYKDQPADFVSRNDVSLLHNSCEIHKYTARSKTLDF